MEQLDVTISDDAYREAVHGGLPSGKDLLFIVKRSATVDGKPAVAITFTAQTPDGVIHRVQATTTLALLVGVADALRPMLGEQINLPPGSPSAN